MTFLHAGVLAGLAAIAIPVVLHLLMRQKPKRFDFPALRLLQNSVKRSTKRLRLRHFWLLLARILILAAFVFAVARPTLPAADWSLSTIGWLLLTIILALAIGIYLSLKRQTERMSLPQRESAARVSRLRLIVPLLAILGAVIAVGIPYVRQVSSSMKQSRTAEDLDLPVAAVFVIDVSQSMSYEREGKTRLEVANELIAEHINDFPAGSRVALVTNGRESDRRDAIFQRTLSQIPNQLERLEVAAASRSLNESIVDGFAVQESDRERTTAGVEGPPQFIRRIYVVTDLQKTAWRFPDSSDLLSALEEQPSTGLFVLDIGVEAPDNRRVDPVVLSQVQIVDGGQVAIRSGVEVTGAPGGEANVELLFEDERSGKAISRDRQAVSGSTSLLFQPTVDIGQEEDPASNSFQQGQIALTGADPLGFDDTQPFSLVVAPLPRILVVAPTDRETDRFVAALGGIDTALAPYRVEVIRPEALNKRRLRETDVVSLINVPSLQDRQWAELQAFVQEGGGLAVFVGSTDIESFSYNRGAPQRLLPAELDVYIGRNRFDPDSAIFVDASGPYFERLAKLELEQLLQTVEIRKFWRAEPNGSGQTLAQLADERVPLLLERSVGEGRVLMFCSAIDYAPGVSRWNNLPTLPGMTWVYIAFLDQSMRYLSRTGSETYNFVAGDPIRIRLPATLSEQMKLKLNAPDGTSRFLDWSPGESTLRLDDLHMTGNYRVTASSQTVAAFSIASDPKESDLRRTDAVDLATLFGDERFQLARTLDELNEEINLAEFGQEGYPALLILACLLFAGEMWLGSRFYGD